MIVTITMNAALDRTLVAPSFRIGESRDADSVLVLGGGKGLNVARALRALGAPVLALGCAGGTVGDQIRRVLDKEGLLHDLTSIAAESRVCTAIVDPVAGLATEVNEAGPMISESEASEFLERYDRALRMARLVVVSGSLPAGLPERFYGMLAARARAAGVPLLLDSRGAGLRGAIDAEPLLIKPNEHEARELLGQIDLQDGPAVLRALPRPGPALVAITLGASGSILHAPAGSWRAEAPPVRPLDTVGAGDSFVAGLAAVLYRAVEAEAGTRRDAQTLLDATRNAIVRPALLEEMLRTATAVATANILTLGAGRCDADDIARLLPLVRIVPLT